jgi:ferredoxin
MGARGGGVGYRPRIDKQSCQSSGRCLAAAPQAFAWDADHLAEPRPGAALPDTELVRIARACPAMAIALLDNAGREVDLYEEGAS